MPGGTAATAGGAGDGPACRASELHALAAASPTGAPGGSFACSFAMHALKAGQPGDRAASGA
jgi:hypothetical protein